MNLCSTKNPIYFCNYLLSQFSRNKFTSFLTTFIKFKEKFQILTGFRNGTSTSFFCMENHELRYQNRLLYWQFWKVLKHMELCWEKWPIFIFVNIFVKVYPLCWFSRKFSSKFSRKFSLFSSIFASKFSRNAKIRKRKFSFQPYFQPYRIHMFITTACCLV